MVSKDRKAELVSKFGQNAKDTGSTKVQIAILTEDINNLTAHLKIHRKDIVSRRSLLQKVAQRKHLLAYLTKIDFNEYKAIIEELGIRK
ncbi:30S ribosomal protein S15 [Spiroplasma sp. NBRC 100390]|uniref:30S ribosomal protein S15 n=1 Tax=unclassified Spiroplasma TaxID=2637901 RepID=UPI0008929718|nr:MULTISPECIES: 30S ribosomal protein S15 [unclassified Spiroplasma]AOX43988.1 30S ribosomal protein S15 [Spiroplasma sp. TU-14]APE13458.1 30S ribosomal protein S15 [Spiroplasma sp. NBRC 100390]